MQFGSPPVHLQGGKETPLTQSIRSQSSHHIVSPVSSLTSEKLPFLITFAIALIPFLN